MSPKINEISNQQTGITRGEFIGKVAWGTATLAMFGAGGYQLLTGERPTFLNPFVSGEISDEDFCARRIGVEEQVFLETQDSLKDLAESERPTTVIPIGGRRIKTLLVRNNYPAGYPNHPGLLIADIQMAEFVLALEDVLLEKAKETGIEVTEREPVTVTVDFIPAGVAYNEIGALGLADRAFSNVPGESIGFHVFIDAKSWDFAPLDVDKQIAAMLGGLVNPILADEFTAGIIDSPTPLDDFGRIDYEADRRRISIEEAHSFSVNKLVEAATYGDYDTYLDIMTDMQTNYATELQLNYGIRPGDLPIFSSTAFNRIKSVLDRCGVALVGKNA